MIRRPPFISFLQCGYFPALFAVCLVAALNLCTTVGVRADTMEWDDTLFVAPYGIDSVEYGTRSLPYRTIQFAINNVGSFGVVVAVFPGTYNEAVFFDGGYPVQLLALNGPDETIIDGAGLGNPITFYGLEKQARQDEFRSIVDGFTITCSDCRSFAGSGLYIDGEDPIIRNNKIVDNVFDASEGSETLGGGIYLYYADPLIYNNLIAGNTARAGGGIYIGDNSDPRLVNNTIVDNTSGSIGTGAGIHIWQRGYADIKNCIVAENNVGWGVYSESALEGLPRIAYTMFYNNAAGNYSPQGLNLTDEVTIKVPGFRSVTGEDYRFICHANAQNQGDLLAIDTLADFDLAGNPRVAYQAPDLGCYEFIDDEKVASFTASPTLGCDQLIVEFENTSTCIDEQWLWDFGDGATSIEKNPIHEYTAPDLYTVTLIAIGDYSRDTIIKVNHIKVFGAVEADFSPDTTEGCIPFDVAFTPTITGIIDDYFWDFGDGTTSTMMSPVHRYDSAGVFTVRFRARNVCDSQWVEKTDLISIGKPPSVDFTSSLDPDSIDVDGVCSPAEVQFYTISDDPLLSYEWDFGDNHFSTERDPAHTYETGGTYSVRLIVTAACGTSQRSRTDYITVLPRPTLSAAASQTSGCAPLEVAFDLTTDQPVESVQWDFGDGDTGTGLSPTHEYESVGTFPVTVVVTHSCGTDVVQLSDTISVQGHPVTAFDCPEGYGLAPYEVSFTDLSSNVPTRWTWDFGDGDSSYVADPTHVYDEPGVYTVSHTAGNACGAGEPVVSTECVTVGSFAFNIGGAQATGDTIIYPLYLDTLVTPYPNLLTLSAEVEPTPRRGELAVTFPPGPIFAPDTLAMLVTPSADLPTGIYNVTVRAVDTELNVERLAAVLVEHSGTSFLEFEPDTVDFDSVVTRTAKLLPVTITNSAPVGSGVILTVESVSEEGDGFDAPPLEDLEIDPDSSITFNVKFRPTARRVYNGVLTIQTDDPVVTDTTIFLTGRGIPEQVAPTVLINRPEDNETDVLISDTIRIAFTEPVTIEETDTTVVVESARLGWRLEGQLEIEDDLLRFIGSDFWPAFDTLSVRVVSDRIVDSVYNRLDGDFDGREEGSPIDDFTFSFITGPEVYPGDTDNDRLVDERDVLPLGRFWGTTGPARPITYESFAPQPVHLWDDSAATYADADGDGVVDSMDVCPILEFWSDAASAPPRGQEEVLNRLAGFHQATLWAIYHAIDYCPEPGQGAATLKGVLEQWLHDSDGPVPREFSLLQNYPNPFNASTIITFELSQPAGVELVVYNTLGERVAVLVDEYRDAGRHVVLWDGRRADQKSVGSGMYFYRLNAGEFTQTRKMMLIK